MKKMITGMVMCAFALVTLAVGTARADTASCIRACENGAVTDDEVAACPGKCAQPPGPCDDKPGTKWCKVTKICVPVAQFATICVGKKPNPPVDTPPQTPVVTDQICAYTGVAVGICPSDCFPGGMLVDGKCVPECDTKVCASAVTKEISALTAKVTALKAEITALKTKPAPKPFDPRWLYVIGGLALVLLIVVLVRQGSKSKPPAKPAAPPPSK